MAQIECAYDQTQVCQKEDNYIPSKEQVRTTMLIKSLKTYEKNNRKVIKYVYLKQRREKRKIWK